jgi:hypothetical protein
MGETLNHLTKYRGFLQFNPSKHKYSKIRPRIICKDGFSLSVQAGWGIYSEPRVYTQFYQKVEVGYPSQEVKELLPYADMPDEPKNPTRIVYAYVPVSLVDSVIEQHGGIDHEATDAQVKED